MDAEEGALGKGNSALGRCFKEKWTELDLERWRNLVSKGGVIPGMHMGY